MFITNYHEFEEYKKREGKALQSMQTNILLGVSGAGKSTLVARALSSLSQQEFYSTIQKCENESRITELSNVRIGGGSSSVTIVPRRYDLGQCSLVDMPGFIEMNENKLIVINLLNKCALNSMKSYKAICVVNMEMLGTPKAPTFVTNYFETYERLFGSKFTDMIENTYFVITHIDKLKMSVAQAAAKISQQVVGSIKTALHYKHKEIAQYIPVFFQCMAEHHMIVNYAEDDQDSLREKLFGMLEDDDRTVKMDSVVASTESLDVYGDTLCKKITGDLTSYRKTIEEAYTDSRHEIDGLERNTEDSYKQVNRLLHDRSEAKRELGQVEHYLSSAEGIVKKEEIQIQKKTKEHKQLEDEVGQVHLVQNTFVNKSANVGMISVRVDSPQSRVQGMIGPDTYKLVLSAHFDAQQVADTVVLITRHEPDDSTLRKHLGSTNDNIIPRDISQIRDFQADIVLYNDGKAGSRRLVHPKIVYNQETKSMDIVVTHTERFKCYIYYQVPFSKSPAYSAMENAYQGEIQHGVDHMACLTKEIEVHKQNIATTWRENKANLDKKVALKTRIGELENSIQKYTTTVKSDLQQYKECIETNLGEWQSFESHELCDYAQKIVVILDKNHLKNDIGLHLRQNSELIAKMLNEFTALKERYSYYEDNIDRIANYEVCV